MNFIRVVLLVLCFQGAAFALEISEIQKKLFDSSVHVHFGESSKGSTGFFILPEKYGKQVIVTCFHCATKKEIIDAAYGSARKDFPKIMVRRLADSQSVEAKIIAYHQLADVLFLQSPFPDSETQLELANEELGVDDDVYGMRYDWKSEGDKLSFMKSKVVAVRNDHETGRPSHIYHRGQAMISGFSGSALVNSEAEVVGVNFFSFNPHFNLSEHIDTFRHMKWFTHSYNLQDFISKGFDANKFLENDAFFEFAKYPDSFFGHDINLIYLAYQNTGYRAFVAFSFADFTYGWLESILDQFDASNEVVKVKNKILFDKLFAAADAAKLLFEKRLKLSSAKASLACSQVRARLKYENKVLGEDISEEDRKNVRDLCTNYVDYLEQDKENLDRMYLADEISVDSTQFIKIKRTAVKDF